jgi:hypothetical protein
MKPTCLCRREVATVPVLSGIGSVVALLCLPKCPACVAAYVALGTGIGLSHSAAGGLRQGLLLVLMVVFLVSLLKLAAHFARRSFPILQNNPQFT